MSAGKLHCVQQSSLFKQRNGEVVEGRGSNYSTEREAKCIQLQQRQRDEAMPQVSTRQVHTTTERDNTSEMGVKI